MHDGSIIVRIKSYMLRPEHGEWSCDYAEPEDVFNAVEILGPWPSRDIAMGKAQEFDNGEWTWKVVDL